MSDVLAVKNNTIFGSSHFTQSLLQMWQSSNMSALRCAMYIGWKHLTTTFTHRNSRQYMFRTICGNRHCCDLAEGFFCALAVSTDTSVTLREGEEWVRRRPSLSLQHLWSRTRQQTLWGRGRVVAGPGWRRWHSDWCSVLPPGQTEWWRQLTPT